MMMKKIGIITAAVVLIAVAASCNKVRRSPGRAYMPDMAYSRAVETYSSTDELKQKGINYNAMPVAGTIARGDMLFQYPFANDSAGYANSASVTNPLPSLDAKQYLEAARLYLVNCGICHGEKLDGNGPLWKDGNGPYPAAPKNLMGADMIAMKEGTMYHSVTYGKGQMGSYASQLSTEERWMVIHYIKEKQGMSGGQSAKKDSAAVNPVDTTAKAGAIK
jgi:mono/diheme cytochrome c family protein